MSEKLGEHKIETKQSSTPNRDGKPTLEMATNLGAAREELGPDFDRMPLERLHMLTKAGDESIRAATAVPKKFEPNVVRAVAEDRYHKRIERRRQMKVLLIALPLISLVAIAFAVYMMDEIVETIALIFESL